MNDNLPTEQQPKETTQPTIRDLEKKIYEHSIQIDEVFTFTRIVTEHFGSGFDISSEESLHCFSMFDRNIRELISRCEDLQDFIVKLRHLDDRPEIDTH